MPIRLRPQDAVATLEAIYAIDGADDATWSRRVLEAITPSYDQGLGVALIFHRQSEQDPAPRFNVFGSGLPFSTAHAIHIASLTPPAIAHAMLGRTVHVATTSQLTGGSAWMRASTGWQELTSPYGMRDSVGLFATHAGLMNVSLNAPLGRIHAVTRRERWPLLQLATHLVSALRIRHRARDTDAVIRPDGVVVDAARDARPASVREDLRDRVKAIEWARTKGRKKDDLEALDVWKGLLDGRWSLVEQIESDGKRFYVARENAVAGVGPNALLPRERQVLALAAAGLTNKVVAYTLGISASTVSLHLRAAGEKIGARSRTDLLRLAASMAPCA